MEFTKDDLKDWDIVVTREGGRYFVNLAHGILIRGRGYTELFLYNADLKNESVSDLDIVEVHRVSQGSKNYCTEGYFTDLNNLPFVCLDDSTLIWEEWRPKDGEEYYIPSITSDFYFNLVTWRGVWDDKKFLSRGMVFKTKEPAVEVAKKMLELVKDM